MYNEEFAAKYANEAKVSHLDLQFNTTRTRDNIEVPRLTQSATSYAPDAESNSAESIAVIDCLFVMVLAPMLALYMPMCADNNAPASAWHPRSLVNKCMCWCALLQDATMRRLAGVEAYPSDEVWNARPLTDYTVEELQSMLREA